MVFSFIPLQRSDYPLLSAWLRQPHVAEWWADDPDLGALELQYGACIDGKEACQVFLACDEDQPIGLVQYFLMADYPEYQAEIAEHMLIPQHTASMDYLIGSAQHVYRGLGRHMLSCFIEKVFLDPIEHLVVPTHLDNKASWRVLEKLGFQRVAICEMEPDNPQHSTAHAIYLKSRV